MILLTDDMIQNVINGTASKCYRTAQEHGFHDGPNPLPQSLCLIHSEVSEALEAFRDDDMLSYEASDKPNGVMSELADIIIRTLDTAEETMPGMIGQVLMQKIAYNQIRDIGHGRVRL